MKFSVEHKRLVESLCCKWRPLATQQVTWGHLPKRRKILVGKWAMEDNFRNVRQCSTTIPLQPVPKKPPWSQPEPKWTHLSFWNRQNSLIYEKKTRVVYGSVFLCKLSVHKFRGFNSMERWGVLFKVFFELKTTVSTIWIENVNATLPWILVGG